MLEINRRGMYGGAGIFTFQSADGWMFLIFTGEGPDGFGAYVYKTKDGKQERVPLSYFSKSRPSADLEADGLYVTLFKNDETGVVRIKVPGFVMPGYPSNGQSGGQLPPAPTEAIDSVARGSIASIQNKLNDTATIVKRETDNLWNAIITDRKKVTALEAKVNAIPNTVGSGITRDQAWQMALDAQYWGITSPDSDARKKLIELIIATNQGGDPNLSPEVIKAIATEVDKAIDTITAKVVAALQS